MSDENNIIKIIDNSGIENLQIVHNADLRKLLTYRINASIPSLIIAESNEALKSIIRYLKDYNIEYYILGGGSNSLINDRNSNIVIIKLGRFFDNIGFEEDGTIHCGAAYNTGRFVTECYKNGYNFAFLAGIPGTIGGAVAGNSGTKFNAICEFIDTIECLRSRSNHIISDVYKLRKNDFGYRFLDIENLLVITKVHFRKERTEKELVFNEILEKIKYKKEIQPLNKFTAGCFFKNPLNSSKTAAELIDSLGLKGFKYGGAAVSRKHANFIENYKNATPMDIYNLSRIIYGMVKDNFNIELENEVKLVGFEKK